MVRMRGQESFCLVVKLSLLRSALLATSYYYYYVHTTCFVWSLLLSIYLSVTYWKFRLAWPSTHTFMPNLTWLTVGYPDSSQLKIWAREVLHNILTSSWDSLDSQFLWIRHCSTYLQLFVPTKLQVWMLSPKPEPPGFTRQVIDKFSLNFCPLQIWLYSSFDFDWV